MLKEEEEEWEEEWEEEEWRRLRVEGRCGTNAAVKDRRRVRKRSMPLVAMRRRQPPRKGGGGMRVSVSVSVSGSGDMVRCTRRGS